MQFIKCWIAFAFVASVTTPLRAQTASFSDRLANYSQIQQKRLEALIDGRAGMLERVAPFSAAEIEASWRNVLTLNSPGPLTPTQLDALSKKIEQVPRPLQEGLLKIVKVDSPVIPVCSTCPQGLAKTCHASISNEWRAKAAEFLAKHKKIAAAVLSIYVKKLNALPTLVGTGAVVQGRIVVNQHILVDNRFVEPRADGSFKIADGVQISIKGDFNDQGISLPNDSRMTLHSTADIMAIKWPTGHPVPEGLTLTSTALLPNATVAVMGYPTERVNSADNLADFRKVFGLCPTESDELAPLLRVSLGSVFKVDAASDQFEFEGANTLGNSSGSPVISTAEGRLVGLHLSDGSGAKVNLAVGTKSVAELLSGF